MHLWIDNTGLQSAGACIDGRSPVGSEREAKGLLQFATHLVFGDVIEVNGFESDDYKSRSQEALELIRESGVTSHVLEVRELTENDYFDGCRRAAVAASTNLEDDFQPRIGTDVTLNMFELPRDTLERQTRFINWLSDPKSEPDYDAIIESTRAEKSAGAVEFMVASSPELRDAIRSKVNTFEDWSFAESYGLASYLRLRLNTTLSKDREFSYCPALERSEQIAVNESIILSLFTEEIDQIAQELRGKPLGIPSLFEYLVSRSKGDPIGIIQEALALRQETLLLRERLHNLTRRISIDTHHDISLLKKEISELGAALRYKLKISEDRRLINAIRISFVIGVPTVSIELGKAIEWLRIRRLQSEVTVLADVIKGITLLEKNNSDDYRRLLKNASHKRA